MLKKRDNAAQYYKSSRTTDSVLLTDGAYFGIGHFFLLLLPQLARPAQKKGAGSDTKITFSPAWLARQSDTKIAPCALAWRPLFIKNKELIRIILQPKSSNGPALYPRNSKKMIPLYFRDFLLQRWNCLIIVIRNRLGTLKKYRRRPFSHSQVSPSPFLWGP